MEATSGQENERHENKNTRIPPPPPEPPKQCPRCFSFDTRFCYYNNGCSSQPRYLCKSCKRHWTVGGALRDIPIGGGSRKGSKRLKSCPSSHDHASSSNLRGESSTSREQLQPPQPSSSPPPAPLLPPHISGYSNMSLPPANSLYSVPGGNFSSLSRILNDLNRPQGFNQAPLNGVGSVGGESSTNFSFLQGFTRNPNLVSQQQAQQSNNQTLQTEETMAEPSFSSNFWSQGLTNNVDWAENMLLQPRNNFWSASLNRKPADVDEDDHLPGGGTPPPSS